MPGSRWCHRLRQALVIGVAQAFAILPAISRSGSTIAAGLWTGPPRRGRRGVLLSHVDHRDRGLGRCWKPGISPPPLPTPGLAAAFLAAMVAGLFAIYFLVAMLRRGKFHYFAPYCAVLGVFCLLWFAF